MANREWKIIPVKRWGISSPAILNFQLSIFYSRNARPLRYIFGCGPRRFARREKSAEGRLVLRRMKKPMIFFTFFLFFEAYRLTSFLGRGINRLAAPETGADFCRVKGGYGKKSFEYA
jgi:hypothetical protein